MGQVTHAGLKLGRKEQHGDHTKNHARSLKPATAPLDKEEHRCPQPSHEIDDARSPDQD